MMSAAQGSLHGRAMVIHGGGPTPVLNASLAGIVEESSKHPEITGMLGAAYGAAGVLSQNFFDLSAESRENWAQIARTPGSVLGSSRLRLSAEDFEQMISVCQNRNIRFAFVTGGNGTMELALRLGEAAAAVNFELRVIGVPKTIDNDLAHTDHTPGHPSAARFFASALRDIGADNRALGGVTVVEVLGRNAGWLTAATLLARERDDDAPHLVYLPERRLPLQRLLADVDRVYTRLGRAVIAVCEGQLDEEGMPFGADVRTSSRKPLALNLAHVLSRHIERKLGIPTRSEKPGLLGRSCSALVSAVDREESAACGRAAVQRAMAGDSAGMITLERSDAKTYRSDTGWAPLSAVVGYERLLPDAWIPEHASVASPLFLDWIAPLVGPLESSGILSHFWKS